VGQFGGQGAQAVADAVDGVTAEDQAQRRIGGVERGQDGPGGLGRVAGLEAASASASPKPDVAPVISQTRSDREPLLFGVTLVILLPGRRGWARGS